jgi:hypothetical protein
MVNQIIFHPRVETELIDSFNWYQEKKDGLGELFFQSINKKIIELATHPARYPVIKKSFRQANIQKFPFVIIYEFIREENYIIISSVFNTYRNPRLKFKT